MPFIVNPPLGVDLKRPKRNIRTKGAPLEGVLLGGSYLRTPDGRPVVTNGAGLRSVPSGGAYVGGGVGPVRSKMRNNYVMTTGTNTLSFICVFRTTTSTTGATIAALGSDSGSAGNTLAIFTTGTVSAANLRFALQDSAGLLLHNHNSSGITINDGKWHCGVFTCAGFGVWVIDGQDGGSAAVAGGTPTATTFQHICALGNRRTTDSAGATADVALVAVSFKPLTAGEMISLSINPWQIFNTANEWQFDEAAAATFNAAWNVSANTVMTTGARAA